MPRENETGPQMQGSMTGRAAGYCAGNEVPVSTNPVPGRGSQGCGRGFGGWGLPHGVNATGVVGWRRARMGWPAFGATLFGPDPMFSKEKELEALKSQAQYLEDARREVTARIEELEADASESQ